MCGMIVFLLTVSCKRQVVITKEFPSISELRANILKVNEVFKFGKIYKLKDYVVISDRAENVESFFYVYRYPNFEFLYSFGKKGNGPSTYLMPTPFNRTPDNYFSFRDHGKDIFATYLLTDTAAVLSCEGDMKPTEQYAFADEINQMADSLFIRKELWNIYTNEIMDTIPNIFDLEKTMGSDYHPNYDEFIMSSRNERFVQCYLFIDAIDIGSIRNNRIHMDKHIGMESPPEFHLTNKMGGRYGVAFLSNKMYYEGVSCGDKYVYALYANVAMGHFVVQPSDRSSLVEVYSWDGEPVALFKLNKSLQDFFVDEERKVMYGINGEACDDCIYEYQFEK